MIKRFRFSFFLIFLISAAVHAAQSANVSGKAFIEKKSITIGDDLRYKLTIDFPAGYVYTPPDFQSVFSNFEIRDQKAVKSKKHAEYKLTLTAYTTGEVKINPFEMEFTSPAGEKEKIGQPEIPVTVKFLEPGKNDTEEIRDVKPPILPPLSPLIYAALIIAILAAVWYFLFRKKAIRIMQEPVSAGHALSAEELANRRFAELDAKKLPEQGLLKEFYVELSGIVRLYLADKYGVPVIERTTDELFSDLKKLILKKRNLEIKEFMEACDMVKFAKYLPRINESRSDIERAKDIVNRRDGDGGAR